MPNMNQHDLSCFHVRVSHHEGETMVKNVAALFATHKTTGEIEWNSEFMHVPITLALALNSIGCFWEQTTSHFKVPQHQFIDCS